MKTRSKIELLVVISLIVAKCCMLQQQFSGDGALAVILFSAIAVGSTAALVFRSTALAYVLAVGSVFSAFGLARGYIFAPLHSAMSVVLFTRDEAIYLVLAVFLFDLWAEWRLAQAPAEAKL